MGEIADNALPHAVALSWGVAASPQRGPKRELSIERIVESAIEIADADGLAAVSMSKVAASLGYTTMSLYRYVTSKDDLLLLMQDAVLDVPMPPAPQRADWRGELRDWMLLTLAVLRSHPWYLDVPIGGIPITPNHLAVVDAGLRCLRTTALSDHEKMAVILLASGYAMNAAKVERDVSLSTPQPGAHPGHGYLEVLTELVTQERFPSLRPVILSGAYTDDDMDYDDLAFGLERVLDGIERFLDTRDPEALDSTRTPEFAAAAERAELYAKDPAVREIAAKRREAEARLRDLHTRERDAVAKAHARAVTAARKRSRDND